MVISSSIEYRAEVLDPPLLAIPGHSVGGVQTSCEQHCVSVSVWYGARIPANCEYDQPVLKVTLVLLCVIFQRE